MTTSETTELYDLYVVSHDSDTIDEDEVEAFYDFYDKGTRKVLDEQLFKTPGYKLYIKNLNWCLNGAIIGPMTKEMVDEFKKVTNLHHSYHCWTKKAGERPIIIPELNKDIEVRVEEEKVKKLKII